MLLVKMFRCDFEDETARPWSPPIEETSVESLPHFQIVAIDETDNWKQDVQRKCGRAFGIYLYDQGSPRNGCYNLIFLMNQFEKPPTDDDDEFSEMESEGGNIVVARDLIDAIPDDYKLEAERPGQSLTEEEYDAMIDSLQEMWWENPFYFDFPKYAETV